MCWSVQTNMVGDHCTCLTLSAIYAEVSSRYMREDIRAELVLQGPDQIHQVQADYKTKVDGYIFVFNVNSQVR